MRRFLLPTLLAIPAIALLVLGGAYLYDEVLAGDHVSCGVVAAGIDLSRLPPDEAEAAIAAHERALVATPLRLVVDGTEVALLPEDVDLAIDEAAVVGRAMRERREPGFFPAISAWVGTWLSEVDIDVPISHDPDALSAALDRWTDEVVDHPAYEGAIVVVDGRPTPEYPMAGTRIDGDAARSLILAALADTDRPVVALPLTDLVPQITNTDVDAALALAQQLVANPVELRSLEHDDVLLLSEGELASALVSEVVVNSDAVLEVRFDDTRIRALTAPEVGRFTSAPVEATFTFDEVTEELAIVPSVMGRTLDLDQITRVVTTVALGGGRGGLPLKDGAAPAFSTADAEAMGELELVSSYTTNHPCCESRVRNIQLIADMVGGAVVRPGEVFSVNDHVGERTEAKGFVRAGAIIGGRLECCDSPINVGGGTSQFATTLYNAVYFGCYEDVTHTPHSVYFSRYPFIREATLGFPAPDVAFRNDSHAIVYIHTKYTNTSITVELYGNNGGRECESETVGNTNTRIMTMPDGTERRESWSWTYRELLPPTTTTTTPAPTTTAPDTTTTTAPPATTTTAPPATTTTTGG